MSVNNKVTVGTFRKRKAAGEKISMLTVYDAPGAAICHSAGVDSLLLLPYYSGKRAAGVPVCGNRSDLLLVKNVQIV